MRFLKVKVWLAICQLLSSYCVSQAQEPSATEILQRAVKAMGGQEKLAKIENYTSITNTTATGAMTTIKMVVTETNQPPDLAKQLFEIDKGFRILCLAGNQSWQQVGTETATLPRGQKREMERALFRDNINFLKNYNTIGTAIKYIGEQNLGGRTFYILEVESSTKDKFSLYMDAQTALIAKKTYNGSAESGFALFEESYANYQWAEGLYIPHKIIVKTNGKVFIESELTSFKINKDLPQDFFYRR